MMDEEEKIDMNIIRKSDEVILRKEKLKTLKDLELEYLTYSQRENLMEELKTEAVKWIKEDRRAREWHMREARRNDSLEDFEKMKWYDARIGVLKKFLNITEDVDKEEAKA